MQRTVELIIPGLFNLPLHELDSAFLDREFPALNYILRYAARVNNEVYDLEPLLADSLDLPGFQTLPLAQAYLENSSPDDAAYLLCRAVHLKPDMRNAIILPLDNAKETEDDIVKLINDLNNTFKVDCHIKSISDRLWLIHLKQCEAPDGYPHYLSALGRKADQYLEQSKQKLPWYQLINEIQMFMHAHEINQKRFENGLLSINSLWCWGGGRLPELCNKDIHWYTDDESLKGFADKLGISNSVLEVFNHKDVHNYAVYIELSILETLKSDRDEDMERLLSRLEQQLFKPLIHRVKSQRCRLKLRASHQYDLTLSAFSAFKFWRQPQSLSHFTTE